MTPDLKALIERLEKLDRQAYPAPWCWEQCGDKCDDPVLGAAWRDDDDTCTAIAGKLQDFDSDGKEISYYRENLAYDWQGHADGSASANVALTVELRNAFPEILKALRAQPAPRPVEDGEVTQRDKDAVAAFHKASFDCLLNTTDADIDAGVNRAYDLLVQAFARHRQQSLSAARAEEMEVLSGLSSYLGAGLGDDGTTAEQFDKRIRWGIDHLVSGVIQRCASVVEECSKRPNTRWGEVKTRILALGPEYEASQTAVRAALSTEQGEG